jgi:predicted aldo/keto reductase-like oxidoreductase
MPLKQNGIDCVDYLLLYNLSQDDFDSSSKVLHLQKKIINTLQYYND